MQQLRCEIHDTWAAEIELLSKVDYNATPSSEDRQTGHQDCLLCIAKMRFVDETSEENPTVLMTMTYNLSSAV